MRAIFTSFDHFMAMFVAVIGVMWSTVFMPLLGGPLHTYEARAIGTGWHSLRTGEAANIGEAFEIATSLPAEALLPSAHAEELPIQLASAPAQPERLELLGGPDAAFELAPRARRAIAQVEVTRVSSAPMAPAEMTLEPFCGAPATKVGLCEQTAPADSAIAAST
jgi:hypothetical protein